MPMLFGLSFDERSSLGNACERSQGEMKRAGVGEVFEKIEESAKHPTIFSVTREARSDNPEVVGSSPSPATK